MSRSLDEIEFEQHLRSEFLSEAGELLAAAESAFIRLEKEPDNGTLIDNIFRTVHTIKGSSAIVGFKSLSGFAHVFETLLSKLRTKDIRVSATVIDTLLVGVDILNRYVQVLRENPKGEVDSRDAVGRIQNCLEGHLSQTSLPIKTPVGLAGIPLPGGRNDGYQDLYNEGRSKPKFLIVDDDAGVREVVAEMLADFHGQVIMAQSGTDAIAKYDENRGVDVIITDQRMPDLDGTAFVRYVRGRDQNIPVIVISGATEREEAIQFIKAGIFDFVQKPMDDAELVSTVQHALRWAQYRRTVLEVSKNIFRSYLDFRKLAAQIEDHPTKIDKIVVSDFSTSLQKISVLVNRLIATDEAVP